MKTNWIIVKDTATGITYPEQSERLTAYDYLNDTYATANGCTVKRVYEIGPADQKTLQAVWNAYRAGMMQASK